MKNSFFTILFSLFTAVAFSQDSTFVDVSAYYDSIERSFSFEHGTIELKNGIGKIVVPEGFKYLSGEQADKVLVELWGNPRSSVGSLGFLLPEDQPILSENGYVFNIQYDEIGYVKDDDADDIDYGDLLKEMQNDAAEANIEREKGGYEPIEIVGWAAKPFYDKEKKILHWAKEIKFGDSETNTLNYNIRVLGRKGVLVLNAIATMPNLPLVQRDIHNVLGIVQFADGQKYADFDPKIDEVAAWTIGGLVAGKVLAKVGFFAVLLKFWKVILLAATGFFGGIWKKFRGKKEEEISEEEIAPTEETDTPSV